MVDVLQTDAQEYDRDCTTLSRHVLQQLQSFGRGAGPSALMNRIALLARSLLVVSAVLVNGRVLGFTGH